MHLVNCQPSLTFHKESSNPCSKRVHSGMMCGSDSSWLPYYGTCHFSVYYFGVANHLNAVFYIRFSA